ncbi:MAG: hypothetical protein R3E09_11915 [Novosphingobium sp.]|nr:hypothetical protein [Novosphingobium sp.]
MAEDQQDTSKFQIFRAEDAKGLMEEGCMSLEPYTPVQREGMNKLLESGYMEGDEVKVLVNIPGFSLTHVWFKKDYPLPLHSHNADCLYYIIAGSLRIGNQELGPRDSFFVPADVPYAYKPGPDGVELLEIRQEGQFNFATHGKTPAYWEKLAETAAANREDWKTAERPKLNA